MSAPPYMKLYVADYFGDTHHLSAVEHGAYLLLLMAMWRAGGKVPANDENLAAMARCSPHEWAALKPRIMPFFKVVRGRLTHKRVSEEMAKYETVSGKRKLASQAAVEKRRSKNSAQAEPNGHQNDDHLVAKPEPEPELVEDADASSVAGPTKQVLQKAFGIIWAASTAQMRRRSKSQALTFPVFVAAQARAGGPGRLVLAHKRFVEEDEDIQRTGGPGLDRWLRDGKWEAWLPAAPLAPGETAPPGDASLHRLWMQDFKQFPRDWKVHVRGPRPGEAGCRVSPDIQRSFGICPFGEPPLEVGADVLPFAQVTSRSAA